MRLARRSSDPDSARHQRAGAEDVNSAIAGRHATEQHPSAQSQRGLDWFIFFLADVQTGFGPFVAVYLTTQKWTQSEIGLILSIGGIVGLIGQMPGGAIIDAARSERLVAGLAVATIGVSALAYAAWPIFPVIALAAILHAAASCVLGPAIAAISLGLVGPSAIGERLGRNARYASLGNGVAAGVMGAVGYLLSSRAVFVVSFVFVIATLLSLARIRDREIDPEQAHGAIARAEPDPDATSIIHLLHQRPLIVFACAVFLLQFANAAMLPVDGGHRDRALKPVGAGADCALHHRPAGDRRADVAFGRPQGAGVGTPPAAHDRLRRAGASGSVVCDGR